MGRLMDIPTVKTNRVHVVYDDGAAAFDLPAGATYGDLIDMIEAVGEGHRALSINVSFDSHCLPIS